MARKKRVVHFRPEIWTEVASLTDGDVCDVSDLVNEALEYYLKLKCAQEEAKEWAAEFAFTAEELAEADRILDEAGVPRLTGHGASQSDVRQRRADRG
jgi:hypothetical protein